MKIQLRKYAAGDKFWYSNINDYDPTKYLGEWDYEKGVIAGDTKTRRMPAWASRVAGLDPGRYAPTDLSPEYGTMGVGQNHYNYALSVEGLNWYKYNTDSMFDANNNLTDFGKWWILKTDDLLPVGHNARIFNSDGSIKNSITVKLNDAQGRAPVVKTFNLRNPQELKDYILHTRKDLTIGGRHNVAVLKGKRYFYVDNEGKYHWVSPEEAVKYNVSEKPVEEGWDEDPNKRIYWLDYELTGPKDPNNPNPIEEEKKKGLVPAIGGKRYGFDWNKIKEVGAKLFGSPEFIEAGRLAGNLLNNARVYDELLKGIRPDLRQTYLTHRLVVGDEATKLAYYRRAALGQTRAAKPFTSDADRQMAYQYEAKRIGDELRAQGDIADNQEIRRTSDESNQHQWANTQRATEVANANIASINQANALKHNLLALKHSAQWTSIDNFLKNIEYRKRQRLAELQEFDDQIFALLTLSALLDDPRILGAKKRYLEVLEAHKKADGTYDTYNDEVIKAKNDYQKAQYEVSIDLYKKKKEYYLNRGGFLGTFFGKSGGKISVTKTKKKKDDLLYKSTRDAVEHFRKMSKISSDALNRKKPKIEKLAPHPGSTRRYLQGGVAPFTVFTPVALGGETTTRSQASSSSSSDSSKDSKGKETLDLIKSLFKEVAGKGLPVDVNAIYTLMTNLFSKYQAFGEELDTNDIALMYLQSMQQLNGVMHSKQVYEKAKEYATKNDALSEIAVTADGKYIAQKKDDTGELIEVKSLEELKNNENLVPVTNQLLLFLREHHPLLLLQKGDYFIENVINNGMGINKIGAQIKALAGNIGSTEGKLEGISQVESGKIKAGLEMLAEAPNGYYKISTATKSQQEQINAALRYINNMLSPALKATLEAHGGVQLNIMYFLGSQLDYTKEVSISPLTGKAAKDATKGSSGGGKGTDTPASVQFLLGNGYSEVVEFNIGNSQSVKALGRFGILLDKEKNNLGQGSNLLDVSKSLFGPILDLNKATFGGTRLNSNGYSHIMLNNSDCIGVDLPVKKDLSGNYVPDFLQLATIEKAEERIHNEGITNPLQINKIYRELGLPDKFDSNGNIILLNYRRFAGILVILDSKALKGGIPVNVNEISEATDEERELFIEEMKKNGNKDYDLSDGILWSSWGRDKLYKGTIFAPVREDIVAGYTSGGLPLDTDLPNDANAVAMKQYAPKAQQYLKTPPLSSLK